MSATGITLSAHAERKLSDESRILAKSRQGSPCKYANRHTYLGYTSVHRGSIGPTHLTSISGTIFQGAVPTVLSNPIDGGLAEDEGAEVRLPSVSAPNLCHSHLHIKAQKRWRVSRLEFESTGVSDDQNVGMLNMASLS